MGLRRRSGFVFVCEFRFRHFVNLTVELLALQLLVQLVGALSRFCKLVLTVGLSALAATVTVLQRSHYH